MLKQRTGEAIADNQLHEILGEVDLNKNGEVDLDEYLKVIKKSARTHLGYAAIVASIKLLS